MTRAFASHYRLRPVACLSLVLAVLAATGLAYCQTPQATKDPVQIAAQVRAVLQVASKESKVKLDGVGILWLTGNEDTWTVGFVEQIRKWVAAGHVCWMDVELGSRFGANHAFGGTTDVAVVASGAENHALAAGVKKVQAADTFEEMQTVPDGAQPILVSAFRAERVVVAAWPVGKGLIVFRPRPRPDEISWANRGHRRWLEPDLTDGAAFLNNLNRVSLDTLNKAGFPLRTLPAP